MYSNALYWAAIIVSCLLVFFGLLALAERMPALASVAVLILVAALVRALSEDADDVLRPEDRP